MGDTKMAFQLIKTLTQLKPKSPILESVITENQETVWDSTDREHLVQQFYNKLYFDPNSKVVYDDFEYNAPKI